MPRMGKSARGNNEVAGMGMGSNIHQVAQTIVMAAVQQADPSQPMESSARKANAAMTGPRNRNSIDGFI
jgi:hypothetical protein